ncbi:MAG: LacI family DNA-binding transcriptional regulator, partial [Lentisphaeria bacterium]|nr:LacI family DNA-binding transcriptional regulator [Lentisphaeria bacterium]
SLGYDSRRIQSCCVETAALLNGIPSYRLALELSTDIRGKFVFSTSDVVSFSMLEGFREKNLTPGKDFQLLCYDNLEGGLVPREQEPVLSTIDAPRVRIGERAAELLLDRIGKPMDETVIIRIPTKLVIRKTAFV